jgi:CheY-like chemotaxis protein
MIRVLVVEDDMMNRDMLKRRLAWEGYLVILAADGEEAIVAALELLPALILMDLGLPGIDGWEATRQIKALAPTAHIPIIALSAYALSEDRARALAAGCDEFEVKPVEFSRLFRKMARLIDAPRRA